MYLKVLKTFLFSLIPDMFADTRFNPFPKFHDSFNLCHIQDDVKVLTDTTPNKKSHQPSL